MDLNALTVGQPEKLVASLAPKLRDCTSVEQAATVLCQELFTRCTPDSGPDRSLLLSRIFLSLPFTALDPDTARVAAKSKPRPTPDDFCLALVGTHGTEPEWCDRRMTPQYRVVWLSRHVLPRDPLLRRCFEQIGFDLAALGHEQETIWTPHGMSVIDLSQEGELISHLEDGLKARGARTALAVGSAFPDGAISLWIGFSHDPVREPGALPLMSLLPSFWYQIRALYRRRSLFA